MQMHIGTMAKSLDLSCMHLSFQMSHSIEFTFNTSYNCGQVESILRINGLDPVRLISTDIHHPTS